VEQVYQREESRDKVGITIRKYLLYLESLTIKFNNCSELEEIENA